MPRSEPAAVEDPHRRRAVEEDPRYHRAVEVPHLGGGGLALLPHCGGPAPWRRRTRIASTPWRRTRAAVASWRHTVEEEDPRRGGAGARHRGTTPPKRIRRETRCRKTGPWRAPAAARRWRATAAATLRDPTSSLLFFGEREKNVGIREIKRDIYSVERERRETRGAALRRHEIFCPVPRLLNFSRVTPKFSVLRFIFCAGRLKRPTPKIIFFVPVA
jgi:hypothetical protein